MPFQRKRSSIELSEKDFAFLEKLSTLRTESYSKVKRARILIAYVRGLEGRRTAIFQIARRQGGLEGGRTQKKNFQGGKPP